MTADRLDSGRVSFTRRRWSAAFAELSAADVDGPLSAGDIELLSTAAYLLGRDDEGDDLLARAHREYAGSGDDRRAARCAVWLGIHLLNRGAVAQGSGWFARAGRALVGGRGDCAEQGYLLVPEALQVMYGGDVEAARALFRRAADIGDRYADADLRALGTLGLGQSLIRSGRVVEGLRALDEVMVAVTAAEVTPIPAGIIYCAVIETCRGIHDVRRAQEWTAALSHWCESEPDLVPYRGQCLVHRSQMMQLRGDWAGALEEVGRACAQFDRHAEPAAGAAHYQLAELHRLRGDTSLAEECYRTASRWGREPQPGLALLRLDQGALDAAVAGSRRALTELSDPIDRPALLAAHVDILLAAGDVEEARTSAEALAGLAAAARVPWLRALACHARAAVLLREGDPRTALVALREAAAIWQELTAPYEGAWTRALIGLACGSLGDADTAELEFAAARAVFTELDAAPALARLAGLAGGHPSAGGGPLTGREREVLALVALGRTNREIAATLVLSEHTVRRHLQNVFTKLGVPSRAAATAYALQHDLL